MQDPTPILRRAGQLCQSLESDPELREELEREGKLPSHSWDELAAAIRTGSVATLVTLLDAIERAAADAGLDGVTYPTREYHELPPTPQYRNISGWRCPHAQRCGRVHPAADRSAVRTCAATGDELTWISVESG